MPDVSERRWLRRHIASGVLADRHSECPAITMKLVAADVNESHTNYFQAHESGIEQRAGGKIKVDNLSGQPARPASGRVEGVALGTATKDRVFGERLMGQH